LTGRIDVNIITPEANHEALIIPLSDIQGVDLKKHLCGYYSMLPMDLWYIMVDIKVEFYKARVFSSNSVLVTVPLWPYGPLMNRDETARHVDECVTNAMDNARHQYFADFGHRQWKHLDFFPPDGHKVSAKDIYMDAEEDNELDIETVPIQTAHLTEKDMTDLQHWAAWKVARVDILPMKRGRIELAKKRKAAALANKLYATGMKEESED
jgi:hypothetical protein